MADIKIKDLLYFDFNKAASLYSQFTGGLTERLSVTKGTTSEGQGGAKVKLPGIAEVNFGADVAKATSTIESKLFHHNLLNAVEEQLNKLELIADLGQIVKHDVKSPDDIRAAIGDKPYIIASGWSVIEDYNHILSITKEFNNVTEFISKCGTEAAKKTPEYLKIQRQIEEKKQKIKTITDRNLKALEQTKLKSAENLIENMLKPKITPVEKWQLEGIQRFIEVFLPNRINFRIYPFDDCPSFQVICNLKHECFVDQDLEHLLYGYGDRPNIPLAVFGLITSIPSEVGNIFDPMKEFEDEKELDAKVAFEKAFRSVFGAMDEFSDFVRYSRYPNITVHPLAVFRQLH